MLIVHIASRYEGAKNARFWTLKKNVFPSKALKRATLRLARVNKSSLFFFIINDFKQLQKT